MVGVQKKNHVQRLDQLRIGLKFVVGLTEHHVQEVFGVALFGVRVHNVVALLLAVRISSYGADLGHNSCCRFGESILVVDFQQFGIVAGQGIED